MEGESLVKTFLHDIVKAEFVTRIKGRCKKEDDYKVIGNTLRVKKHCVAKFLVCYEVGQKKTTEAAKTTTGTPESGDVSMFFIVFNPKLLNPKRLVGGIDFAQ